MAKPTKRSESRDDMFFFLLGLNHTIEDAANLAGYSRRSVYDYEKSCEKFAVRFKEAREEITKRLEKESDKRILQKAKKLGCYPKTGKVSDIDPSLYSDGLLRFRLMALTGA